MSISHPFQTSKLAAKSRRARNAWGHACGSNQESPNHFYPDSVRVALRYRILEILSWLGKLPAKIRPKEEATTILLLDMQLLSIALIVVEELV